MERTQVLDPGQIEALRVEYERLRLVYPGPGMEPDEDDDDEYEHGGES